MHYLLSSHPLLVTGGVFIAAAGSFAALAIKDRRPRKTLDTPLIPAIPLMLVAGIVAILALAMMLSLAGIQK